MRRLVASIAVAWAAVLVPASPAAADPPAPTDYRSEILSVEPTTDAVELRFIGGDNLVEMSVALGHDVVVIGYRGEPYLWFQPDGTVVENRRSPSTYLNEDRYGALTLPEEADAAADPRWVDVAVDGTYIWHDHRTHWMNERRPLGAGPGDQILEAVVPLDVDGERVQVTVGSWWVDPPSNVPALVGALVGLLLAGLAAWRGQRVVAFVAVGASLLALVVGAVAWFSVPAITKPTPMLWFPALVALLAAVTAGALDATSDRTPPTRDWLLVGSGAALVMWALLRVDWLVRAILPTDVPGWVDRALIASMIPIGVVTVASSLWSRFVAARTRRAVAAA